MAKKRTELDRTMDTVKSLSSEIVSWIGRHAFEAAWTFERILKWRTEHVYNHPRWKKLPRWAHSEVMAKCDLIWAQHDAKLFWTHVLDGKRVLTHDPICNDRHADIHHQSEADPQNSFSAHCFAALLPDGRVVLIPSREEDRAKELATGRLTEADISAAIHHTGKMLSVLHLPNGRPVLGIVCELKPEHTEDGGYVVKHGLTLA